MEIPVSLPISQDGHGGSDIPEVTDAGEEGEDKTDCQEGDDRGEGIPGNYRSREHQQEAKAGNEKENFGRPHLFPLDCLRGKPFPWFLDSGWILLEIFDSRSARRTGPIPGIHPEGTFRTSDVRHFFIVPSYLPESQNHFALRDLSRMIGA